jgi:S1-C subfamily serine protease
VGINTHRIGKGFYLAQPADAQLRSRVDALGRGEVRIRPRLGVGVAPSAVAAQLRQAVGLAPRDGLLVRAVADDSPASSAGIAVGDLIVAVDDAAIHDTDALYLALDGAGTEAVIDLVRGADDHKVTVSFAPAE